MTNEFNDDSDPEFPSIRRLLSPEYQQKLAEGNNAREGNCQIMDDNLFGPGLVAGRSQGKCIRLIGSEYSLKAV